MAPADTESAAAKNSSAHPSRSSRRARARPPRRPGR